MSVINLYVYFFNEIDNNVTEKILQYKPSICYIYEKIHRKYKTIFLGKT